MYHIFEKLESYKNLELENNFEILFHSYIKLIFCLMKKNKSCHYVYNPNS